MSSSKDRRVDDGVLRSEERLERDISEEPMVRNRKTMRWGSS